MDPGVFVGATPTPLDERPARRNPPILWTNNECTQQSVPARQPFEDRRAEPVEYNGLY